MIFEEMLDATTLELLERMGPGVAELGRLREAFIAGALSPELNRVRGRVEPPLPGDLIEVPSGAEALAGLQAEGLAALARGEVGLVLLNGGMATRFGGVVKGVVPVEAQLSFLALKLLDARRAAERAGGPLPIVILMNSLATRDATARHLEENGWFGYDPQRVWSFDQQWSIRLTPEGAVFIEDDGQPSFYGPGHGDLGPCLRRSGLLDRFVAAGGRTLLMSNVDNVVATLDPVLTASHRRSGAAITVEVVDKLPGDAGGSPARVDGHLQVVESFRFPLDFDQDRIPVFNTNTLWFETRALAEQAPLTWFVVHKKVDGRPVIQFERLVNELTTWLPSAFVRVPRAGDATRFIPIKAPDDLERERGALMRAWRSRG